jgi:hypothetical protein
MYTPNPARSSQHITRLLTFQAHILSIRYDACLYETNIDTVFKYWQKLGKNLTTNSPTFTDMIYKFCTLQFVICRWVSEQNSS